VKHLKDIHEMKGFIQFDKALDMIGYEVVGYFPYETARVKGHKISRSFARPLEHALQDARYHTDNKVVYICRDKTRFGTHNFAVFCHDNGTIIGSFDDVVEY